MSDDLQEASDRPDLSEAPAVHPGDSALRVLQRTAAAISPWIRPWWGGEGSRVSPSSDQTAVRVAGDRPLVSRVQRSLALAADPDGGGELGDRFSRLIV
jgi:hypothetical protein